MILTAGTVTSFSLDVFQAGAGTSYNMNVNEVIANRALEIVRLIKPHPEKMRVDTGKSVKEVVDEE